MKYTYLLNIFVAGSLVFTSCDAYLDESPSKSSGIEISTIGELEALLSYNNFNGSSTLDNNIASIVCSDCFEINPEYYDGGLKELTNAPGNYQLACWEMALTQNTNENTSMWAVNYGAVYLANLILTNISDAEGDKDAKARVSHKAHLLRAYNYLDLVQYYCMPYSESTLSEPGLPLKRSTSYEEDFSRASLEDTYQFIEEDILEAVKLTTPLFENGERKSWKETGATANALAARFYLLKGDYVSAQKYAEEALKYGNDLLDFNNPDNIASSFTIFMGDMSMVPVSTWWEPKDYSEKFTGEKERSFYWKKNFYLMSNIWGIPSSKLLHAYEVDYDLRYRYFIVNEFQKIFFLGMNAGLFTRDVPGYATFNNLYSTAPNVAEMILTRAECMARNGHPDEAMKVVNDFRKYRMDSNTPVEKLNLTANGQNDAVKKILEERMREFPFTLRWNDIRRCNFNNDANDDVTITRTFYKILEYSIDRGNIATYTLTPQSRGYAVAIPNAELISSDGKIKQNRY